MFRVEGVELTKNRRDAFRLFAASAAALVIGLFIAWMDTRPTWDDTGVTAGALLIGSGLAGFLGLPFALAAAFVAGPLALIMVIQTSGVSIVVLLIGIAGGFMGRVLGNTVNPHSS